MVEEHVSIRRDVENERLRQMRKPAKVSTDHRSERAFALEAQDTYQEWPQRRASMPAPAPTGRHVYPQSDERYKHITIGTLVVLALLAAVSFVVLVSIKWLST